MKYVLKDNRTGGEAIYKTTVEVTIDDKYINFYFDAKTSKLYSAYEGYNTNIYEGDVCEAFICTDGSRNIYYEIEISPNNSIFFKRVENYGDDNRKSYAMLNTITSSVEINGEDYIAQFSIPLKDIGYDKEIGILFNAYRIDTDGGVKRDGHLFAVNPTLSGTFHKPEFFIEL